MALRAFLRLLCFPPSALLVFLMTGPGQVQNIRDYAARLVSKSDEQAAFVEELKAVAVRCPPGTPEDGGRDMCILSPCPTAISLVSNVLVDSKRRARYTDSTSVLFFGRAQANRDFHLSCFIAAVLGPVGARGRRDRGVHPSHPSLPTFLSAFSVTAC